MDCSQFANDVEKALLKFMHELSCAGCKRQPLVSIYGLIFSRSEERWEVTSYDSDDQNWTMIKKGKRITRFCPDCVPNEVNEAMEEKEK